MSWLSAAWYWYAAERLSQSGAVDHPNAALVNPIVASFGAALLIVAALLQAATARRRHKEQTDADRQRRITESFSKAAEQLGSDKPEVRLGGIYSLERISKESPDDYWTVMETLCAFVRERARWRVPDSSASETMAYGKQFDETQDRQAPPTDIAAVLAVIVRRPEKEQKREKRERWRLDLSGTDLRWADLRNAGFELANLRGAHLDGTDLSNARLQGADLMYGHLKTVDLIDAYLQGADLRDADLESAKLWGANFERAHLGGANLRGADFRGEGFGDIDKGPRLARGVTVISQEQLDSALGDSSTWLPVGLRYPAHWVPPEFGEPDEPSEPSD
jgi:hypothetical protein